MHLVVRLNNGACSKTESWRAHRWHAVPDTTIAGAGGRRSPPTSSRLLIACLLYFYQASMKAIQLYTSRYGATTEVVQSGLAPVGITLGRPRFKLGYPMAGWARLLAPTPALFAIKSVDEYFAGYETQLEETGPGPIRVELDEIATRTNSSGLVLLCFEDVWAGERCHRVTFSGFWLRHMGRLSRNSLPHNRCSGMPTRLPHNSHSVVSKS